MMKPETNEAKEIREYREAGLSPRNARLQYRLYLRASAPQNVRVTFSLDEQTYADLVAAAKERGDSLGEVIRGRLRLAEGVIDEERAGRERARRKSLKMQAKMTQEEWEK